MQKISVMTTAGSVITSVWFVKEGKGLAVQKMLGVKNYGIVHMLSKKLAMSNLSGLQTAKDAMLALLTLSIDWMDDGDSVTEQMGQGDNYDRYKRIRSKFCSR